MVQVSVLPNEEVDWVLPNFSQITQMKTCVLHQGEQEMSSAHSTSP